MLLEKQPNFIHQSILEQFSCHRASSGTYAEFTELSASSLPCDCHAWERIVICDQFRSKKSAFLRDSTLYLRCMILSTILCKCSSAVANFALKLVIHLFLSCHALLDGDKWQYFAASISLGGKVDT